MTPQWQTRRAARRLRLLCLLHVPLCIVATLMAAAATWAAAPQVNPTPLEQRPLERGQVVQPSQPATPPSSDGIGFGRLGLSLAAVVGLILLMRWGGAKLFKGQGGPNSNGVMQVVARAPIAPRQQLMLVRIGRRLVMVGNSGGQMTALSQITEDDEVAEVLGQLKRTGESAPSRFTAMFHRAERNYEEAEDAAEAAAPADAAADRPEGSEPNSPAVMSAELGKLLEKVRGMARQLR